MSLSLGLRENEPGVRVQTFFGLPSTEEDVTQRRPESTAEELLLDRLRSGEEAAFLELMQRYHTSLLGTARFYVRKRDVAEEVVQDTWMSVLRGIHRFEARSSLKTWIFRILVNCAIKRRKREEKLVPFSSLVETETEAGELAISPDRFHPAGDLSQGHWASPPASWGENPKRGCWLKRAWSSCGTLLKSCRQHKRPSSHSGMSAAGHRGRFVLFSRSPQPTKECCCIELDPRLEMPWKPTWERTESLPLNLRPAPFSAVPVTDRALL